jgi:hypothetical protein
MSDELIGRIRAIDPVLRMPPVTNSVREATRESVLESNLYVPARGARTRRTPTRARRGLLVALASALLIVAVPATGAWAYFTYFTGPETVMDEFHQAQKDMPLPAGAQWTEPSLPDNAVYGSKLGLIAAWGQATNAWFREWIAADEAKDAERAQAAIGAVERLISMAPIHRDGDPEEAGGFVKESIIFFNGIVDRAKQGDFSGIQDYLGANP